MYYGNIKFYATEDGPGCRTILFVSGCRHHCEGCFQPKTWDFDYGQKFTKDTSDTIIKSLQDRFTSGLTVLGGEPFEPENQPEILKLLKRVKTETPGKNIWIYTGCLFEDLITENNRYHTEHTNEIIKLTDVIVDGPFVLSKKDLMLRFKGSENQRIIDVQKTLATKNITLSSYNKKRDRGKNNDVE